MDAVGPPGHERPGVLPGQPDGDADQPVELLEEEARRLPHLQRQAGVEDVGRRHPVVQVPGGRADAARHVVEEGGDIVAGPALDLRDPLGVEGSFGFDHVEVGLRDLTRQRPRLGRQDLDAQPVGEPGLLAPDGPHPRPGIPLDHAVAVTGGGPG